MPDSEVIESPEVPEATPTDPPAPAADVEKTEPEKTPEELAAQAKLEEQKKLSRTQRAAQRAREESIAERTRLETENRLLREQLQGKAPPKPVVDEAPKRDDFQDYELYLEAKAEYKARQIVEAELKRDREARQGQDRQSKEAREAAERAESWKEREAAYSMATPDYEERVNEYVHSGALDRLSDQARQSIVEAGPELLDYLATHPDETKRVAQLTPLRQVAELGKLETRLEKAPPKPTNAPAPASPIASARSSDKDISKMSAKEIEADMKKRGSRWVR